MKVSGIDWAAWRPHDTAAITYLLNDGQVLLIHKKRGLGAGKVNAPGGRLEAGERPVEAAVREVREEVGLTITGGLKKIGEQRHQFVDGLALMLHVFVATAYEGQLVETDEARPFWTPRSAIPYDQLWADNALWLPAVLRGAGVDGRYVFDGDAMIDFDVRLLPLSDPAKG